MNFRCTKQTCVGFSKLRVQKEMHPYSPARVDSLLLLLRPQGPVGMVTCKFITTEVRLNIVKMYFLPHRKQPLSIKVNTGWLTLFRCVIAIYC